ncbi:hypothetical protein FRC09_020721 [Ceratobasidium sp. 395]|nr:hypothetical protein FRC09_020721 [Ceratobasidium sp. 395]
MFNVHTALGAVRNQSKSLASLTGLPDELLVYILSLVIVDVPVDPRYDEDHPTEQPLSPLFSIMATTRRLRGIITNTPSLWTFISLVVKDEGRTYLRHGQRFLFYSQHLPIHVRVTGYTMVGYSTRYTSGDYSRATKNLTRLLGSHAHRIVSLDLQLPLMCAWPFILGLFSNNPSCQIQELYLNDRGGSPQQLDGDFPDRFFEGDLNTFFQSLQVIRMCGFFIPFTSLVYHGLTVLEIMPYGFRMSNPTLVELRNALVACPKLRSLALIECEFEFDSEVSIEPVLLPNLEILDLRVTTDDDELVALMSCIDSGPNELAFSVSLDPDTSEDAMAIMLHFIRKSNVTRLCIDSTLIEHSIDLDWLLALPQGETLAIRELALCSYYVRKDTPLKQPLSADHFPFLHTLHLMRWGELHVHTCRQVLETSAVQVLRFDEPQYGTVPEMTKVAPFVEDCRFSTGTSSKGDNLEWPIYVF